MMEKTNNQKEQKEKPTFKITDKGKGGNSDYPAADKIGSRSSTVARAMASTLMPRIGATNQEKRNIVLLSLGKNIDNEIDKKMDGANTVEIKDKKGKVIGKSIRKDIKDKNKRPRTLIRDEFNDKEGNVIRTLIRDEEWKVITTSKLGDLKCVYCGEPATNLDHLFPFIRDKRPTGYFTEPANLVPCCDKCNQKKGAKYWYDYMKDGNNFANHDNPEAIKNRLPFLFKKLNDYCFNNHLPYQDENGETISSNNSHRLKLFDEPDKNGISTWWTELYNSIVIALDSAQIQIDAFNAGIIQEYILSQNIIIEKNNVNLNKHFEDFFERFWNDLSKPEKDEENSLKYKRFLEDMKFTQEGKAQEKTPSKEVYDKSLEAYMKGFYYAYSAGNDEKEIIHTCIKNMSEANRKPKILKFAGLIK